MRLNDERPGGLTKRQIIEAVHRAGLPKSRAFLPPPQWVQWVDVVPGVQIRHHQSPRPTLSTGEGSPLGKTIVDSGLLELIPDLVISEVRR